MPRSAASTPPSSPKIGERDDVNGLETWHDPIPRRSEFTIKDLHDAFVAAAEAERAAMPKRPSPEERARTIQERQRNILLTALNKYAKQNNVQVRESKFLLYYLIITYTVQDQSD